MGRVILNRSSGRAASLVGWGLFTTRYGGVVADKSQPTKCEAFMVGCADGSRVVGSGLILVCTTLSSGWAASLVGWGLF